MQYVTFVAYKCKPSEIQVGDCRTQPVACGKEERPGEVVYHLPCGRAVVKPNVALFSGKPDCDPARFGLSDCELYHAIYVVNNLKPPKEECVVGDDGKALQLKVFCDGKPIIARYFPTRGTLVLFARSEECLQKVLQCF
ncbi:MAG: hypothetical protein QXI84_10705 [Thermofilaceae archaeon]